LVGIEGTKTACAFATVTKVHPENPEITSSGRCRKPLWLIAAFRAGKNPDK